MHLVVSERAPRPTPKRSERKPLKALADEQPGAWTTRAIFQLHMILLEELRRLADPLTPLEEKFDILQWVYTENRELDAKPFSFVNCIKLWAGSSPHYGAMSAEEVRAQIARHVPAWLSATLGRYPEWLQDLVRTNPNWVWARLRKNRQFLNQQAKRCVNGDLFC